MKVKVYDDYTGEQYQVELNILEEPLRIVDYSEKSIAVFGGTPEFRTELDNNGGEFNRYLEGGAGWIFSKRHRERVEELVSYFNRITEIKELSLDLQEKPQAKETMFTGQVFRIVQLSEGTFNLIGNTTLFEDELIALGCQKIDDAKEPTWYFTRNKLVAVRALVSAIHKLK